MVLIDRRQCHRIQCYTGTDGYIQRMLTAMLGNDHAGIACFDDDVRDPIKLIAEDQRNWAERHSWY